MFKPLKIEAAIAAGEEKVSGDTIAKTLATITLPVLAPGGRVTEPPHWNAADSVAVASYEDWFDYLWRFPPELLNWLAAGKPPLEIRTLILIWDGVVPLGGKGAGVAAEFVTARDWAVALALKAKSNVSSDSPWRVLILDVSPVTASLTLTARLFEMAGAKLPMISFFRHNELANLLEAINKPVPSASAVDRDLIKRLWASAIIQPEDLEKRHSISNVIGIRILLAGMRGANAAGTGAVVALEQLMSILDLVPDAANIKPRPWFDWPSPAVPKFVLVDDMADFGWADFVSEALGLNSPQLVTCTAPDGGGFGKDKSKSLVDLIVDKDKKLRVNKGLRLTGAEDEDVGEILFLDLRLFGERSAAEEQEFIRSLLPLAESARGKPPKLPWPGFHSNELAAVKDYLKTGKRETRGYFVALTLLPRLVALVDPRLPIILFSSTGRRVISDPLSRYGNIIREFDKPRFFGKASNSAFNLVSASFNGAVGRAIRFLRGRKLHHQLTEIAPIRFSKEPEKGKYVEVYIDESFDIDRNDVLKAAKVSGLAAIYPHEQAAREFNERLHGHTPKLVWGFDEKCIETMVEAPLPKRTTPNIVKDHFAHLDRLAQSCGVTLNTFLLKASEQSLVNASRTQSPCDYIYRELLRNVLECFLFLWPQGRMPGTSTQMFAGTRKDVGPNRAWAEKWNRRFGTFYFFDQTERQWCVLTLRHDDVRPIVEGICAQRHSHTPSYSARGATLRYYRYDEKGKIWAIDRLPKEETKEPQPRQIHYAADWVTGYPDCVPPDWWLDGFREIADKDFERLVQASRFAERTDMSVEAVAEWGQVCEARRTQDGSIARWVWGALKPCVQKLEGLDFVRLCDALPVQ